MAFSSKLFTGERIINDDPSSFQHSEPQDGQGRGLRLELRGPGDFEYGEVAKPFPKELYVPKADWQGMIKEQEEQGSRLSDLIRFHRLDHKDQSNTNYCWINSPTHCCEIGYLQTNGKKISLSPASAGAQIKGFRNVGGWGKEGLEFILAHGLVPSKYWPDNAIDRKYLTEENKKRAMAYRIDEWVEAVPRNLEQMVSLLLRRIPLAAGYNWWRHEVTLCDVLWIDGEIAIRFRNSWKGYGDYGFSVLQGSKMYADDLVGCVNVRPNSLAV